MNYTLLQGNAMLSDTRPFLQSSRVYWSIFIFSFSPLCVSFIRLYKLYVSPVVRVYKYTSVVGIGAEASPKMPRPKVISVGKGHVASPQ